jgi:hypothetical protein
MALRVGRPIILIQVEVRAARCRLAMWCPLLAAWPSRWFAATPSQCALALSGELSQRSAERATRAVSKALIEAGQVLIDMSRLRLTWTPAVQLFPSPVATSGGWPGARLVVLGANAELSSPCDRAEHACSSRQPVNIGSSMRSTTTRCSSRASWLRTPSCTHLMPTECPTRRTRVDHRGTRLRLPRSARTTGHQRGGPPRSRACSCRRHQPSMGSQPGRGRQRARGRSCQLRTP